MGDGHRARCALDGREAVAVADRDRGGLRRSARPDRGQAQLRADPDPRLGPVRPGRAGQDRHHPVDGLGEVDLPGHVPGEVGQRLVRSGPLAVDEAVREQLGAAPGQPAIQLSGQGDPGSFGPLVEAIYQARRTAIDRMTAECDGLGAHGVVGVRLSRRTFPLGGLEFTAIGTAVRAPGAAHGPGAPFTCGTSGQDFARLVMAGWVPAGLALGISIGSRHDDRAAARQTRQWSGNVEVVGWTELVNQSQHDARGRLEGEVRRFGAEGVVIAGMQMRVRQSDCPVMAGRHDHVVEVTLTGTAIARFSRAGPRRAGPALAVMTLDPRRSQSVRISI